VVLGEGAFYVERSNPVESLVSSEETPSSRKQFPRLRTLAASASNFLDSARSQRKQFPRLRWLLAASLCPPGSRAPLHLHSLFCNGQKQLIHYTDGLVIYFYTADLSPPKAGPPHGQSSHMTAVGEAGTPVAFSVGEKSAATLVHPNRVASPACHPPGRVSTAAVLWRFEEGREGGREKGACARCGASSSSWDGQG